jgi:hypothetical protein
MVLSHSGHLPVLDVCLRVRTAFTRTTEEKELPARDAEVV